MGAGPSDASRGLGGLPCLRGPAARGCPGAARLADRVCPAWRRASGTVSHVWAAPGGRHGHSARWGVASCTVWGARRLRQVWGRRRGVVGRGAVCLASARWRPVSGRRRASGLCWPWNDGLRRLIRGLQRRGWAPRRGGDCPQSPEPWGGGEKTSSGRIGTRYGQPVVGASPGQSVGGRDVVRARSVVGRRVVCVGARRTSTLSVRPPHIPYSHRNAKTERRGQQPQGRKAKTTIPRQTGQDRTPPAPLHTRRPCGGPHRGGTGRGGRGGASQGTNPRG